MVAGARQRAAELGRPERAPPIPLEDCDEGAVVAALASPRGGWDGFEKYGDLAAKASALLYAFATIQPCIDGNKRLTLLLVDAFIRLNGGRLTAQRGELAEKIVDVAEDPRDRDAVHHALVPWLRARIQTAAEEGLT